MVAEDGPGRRPDKTALQPRHGISYSGALISLLYVAFRIIVEL